mmetsp:Transcript_41834/g.89263  ORF Transcript_41834/g.89263 Transcript_41834/m.89263 type:complete len:215 (-) Transcript_41834:61-705(-)
MRPLTRPSSVRLPVRSTICTRESARRKTRKSLTWQHQWCVWLQSVSTRFGRRSGVHERHRRSHRVTARSLRTSSTGLWRAMTPLVSIAGTRLWALEAGQSRARISTPPSAKPRLLCVAALRAGMPEGACAAANFDQPEAFSLLYFEVLLRSICVCSCARRRPQGERRRTSTSPQVLECLTGPARPDSHFGIRKRTGLFRREMFMFGWEGFYRTR